MKHEIIQEFLNDTKANYSVYGTSYEELSRMYDDLMRWLKQNKTFTAWLVTESAMHPDGTVRFDRQVTLQQDKTSQLVNIVFKYFVYNYLFRKINNYKNESETKDTRLSEKWRMEMSDKSKLFHERR